MAVITTALLAALRTEVRRQFSDAYEQMRAESFYQTVAMIAPSSTTSNTYAWLGDWPALREWIGDRVIKDIKENGYQITNKLYEATLGIPRVAIEDDTVGTLKTQIQHMAETAARHPDLMIAALLAAGNASLCYDGQYFFDNDHPLYANHDGTGALTTQTNVQAGAATPWYLIDARGGLKPLIFQERTKPEFDTMEDPKSNDNVFIKDQYLYGIRYRCNGGYGFWQKALRSTAVLNNDNLDLAISQMMSLKGDGGKPLGITPTHLIVPPSLNPGDGPLTDLHHADASDRAAQPARSLEQGGQGHADRWRGIERQLSGGRSDRHPVAGLRRSAR